MISLFFWLAFSSADDIGEGFSAWGRSTIDDPVNRLDDQIFHVVLARKVPRETCRAPIVLSPLLELLVKVVDHPLKVQDR